MNPSPLSHDDPRLTAYAFNELPAAERAEFEQLLAADPAARQLVDEIRAAGEMLTAALEAELAPKAAAPAQPTAIVPGGDFRKLDGGPHPLKEKLNQPIRFPQFYYVVSGLAAACFAVFFAYWQQNYELTHKQYIEVDLAKFAAASPADTKAKKESEAASVALPTVATPEAVTLPPPAADEVVALSPFEARNEPAKSAVSGTLAGSRLNTELKDAGTAGTATRSRFAAKRTQPAASGAAPTLGGLLRQDFDTEAYAYKKDNDFRRVAEEPQSTFSIDVDTASYANVRRFLSQGQRPPADAVRIEELVNYFPYRYQPPTGSVPFSANLEVASAPWAPEHRLVRIGLKGREVSDEARPRANLVFLLDVSGSMQAPNKLPLVQQSLRLLVNKLRPDDRVAIAVYAGASGLALPSTPVSRKADILEAIDRLQAGGSTNGAMGIQLAYDIAKANFFSGGVNRVILATDGDFNVGTTSEGELTRLIEEKAKSGVFLSVLGFGMGNLKDATLEMLADKGNGNYAYIDSLAEARKSLVEQAGGTLVTIAKDVKIQVEFNPLKVQAYRLIGYENRLLANADFNNDHVDAGEIGAGHTVTALYEVVPVGAEAPAAATMPTLKYQRPVGATVAVPVSLQDEMLTVSIRYKEPAADESRRLEFPLRDAGTRFEDASVDFKFAAAVAGFGMALRESPHRGSLTLAEVSAWARAGTGDDAGGYRSEFLGLVKQAEALQ